MALDSSKFDVWTKSKTHRDLAFRACVWAVISAVTVRLAIRNGITPIDHFFFFLDAAFPLVRTVDGIVASVAIVAIMYKDLASLYEAGFGEPTKAGSIGIIVRRVASDLCLWILAIYVSILTTAAFAFGYSGHAKYYTIDRPLLAVSLLPQILLPFMIFVVVAYFARDARASPIARLASTPTRLILIHCSLALAILFAHALSLGAASWRSGLKLHSTTHLLTAGLCAVGFVVACILAYLIYSRSRIRA